MSTFLNNLLVDDAFLYLSSRLPETLSEQDKGYLQGLSDFRRHLLEVLKDGKAQTH